MNGRPMMSWLAGLAIAASAGAAQAQSAQALAEAVRPARSEAPVGRVSLASRDAEAHALKLAGIARTSVDRRLAGDDLVGSVGFLCGLQPGADRRGAAAAHGVDPTGRFVGAKLRLAFR